MHSFQVRNDDDATGMPYHDNPALSINYTKLTSLAPEAAGLFKAPMECTDHNTVNYHL